MVSISTLRRQIAYTYRRTSRQHILLALILLCILLILHFPPSPRQHITTWVPGSEKRFGHRPLRTAVVVAAQEKDDVSWIEEGVEEGVGGRGWEVWKYEVDNKEGNLTVPVNKGNEGMVYLTHIIDNYDTLAERIIFIHADRYQWHNDDPRYDALHPLRNLRVEYLSTIGFLNLRCHWSQGCPLAYNLSTPLSSLSSPTFTPSTFEQNYATTFHAFFPALPIPPQIGAPCCSQFAATSSVIRKQPKELYEQMRNWLVETQMEDYMSGRVLEYMWHIVFGKPAVHCGDAGECYCRGFGKCGLKCGGGEDGMGEGDCGVYQYPLNIPRLKTLWWKIKWAWG